MTDVVAVLMKPYTIGDERWKAFVTEGNAIGVNYVEYDDRTEAVKWQEITHDELVVMKKGEYTSLIQKRLDSFAQTRNYDNIMSACSYFGSLNETFNQEAKTCLRLRDETWSKGYELLESFDITKKVPTWEEIEKELPILEW